MQLADAFGSCYNRACRHSDDFLMPCSPGAVLLSTLPGSWQLTSVYFRRLTMLHTGVVVFGLCTVSFAGGICFTLLCLSAKACCQFSPSKGTKDTTEKSMRGSMVKTLPAKRSRPVEEEAGSTNRLQPSAKRPKSEGDMEMGTEAPKIVTVSWPLPRH